MNRLALIRDLAFRFLSRREASGLGRLISSVSVIGVLVGVTALLLVTSVVNGFRQQLSSVISGTQGDVIFYTRTVTIRDPEILEERIRKSVPEISEMSPSLVTEVMISGPNSVGGAVLEGIDPDRWGKVTNVPQHLLNGNLPRENNEIILGKALAEKLGVGIGDLVQVVVPFSAGEDSSVVGTPETIALKVADLVHFGMHEYDSKYSFMTLTGLQEFLRQPKQITTLRIKLKDSELSKQVADQLGAQFGFPYRAKDWMQLNRNLLYAISLEKTVIAILLTAIMIVAAFNVVSALLMMVSEREAEISMLRVLGMRSKDHFFLFTWIGSLVGMVGTGLGILSALVLGIFLKWSKIISLPADVYRLEYLPIVIDGAEWAFIALGAFLICFLATVGPAMRVARKIPVEGLKWSQ